jgi:6,7-dimethyl-8-ribityllumazine synthase
MFGADKGHVDAADARMNGKKLKIGIVHASFNASVTDALAQA